MQGYIEFWVEGLGFRAGSIVIDANSAPRG